MTAAFIADHGALAAGTFVLSALLSWLVIRLGIVDDPNQRSSHDRPVARGGGIAIVGAVAAAAAVLWAGGGPMPPGAAALAAAALGMAAVGLADDLRLLRTFRGKLAAQVAAAVLVAASGLVVERLWLPFAGEIALGWWGWPLTVLWIVGLTNAFNFMDGLDGLAGGAAAIAGGFFAAIAAATAAGPISLFVAAACAGFLLLNAPPARLFMGDVGSQFLGFAFAALAVAATVEQPAVPFLAMPVLFLHFIADTAFTLGRRLAAGETVTQAHRGHLYQLLNRTGWPHARVTLLLAAMGLAQGAAALLLADGAGGPALAAVLAAQSVYAVLVVRRARRRGLIGSAPK
ncbi:MAG: glycosyltransferase family 4 protein [Rhodospirillales bacterium]